jgi:ABC-type sugar transport system ATPase subunit
VGGGLEFHGLSKSFGAVHALTDVSFSVKEGEAHACIGENGAGKSTLLKILAGLVTPDHGSIAWQGQTLHLTSPRAALERGIGLVYQEVMTFPNLRVSGNIFAGREITRGGGRLDEREMRERTRALLARLQIPVSPDTRMERLPAAYCQLVQVARAIAFDCHVLALDEPTTSLTDAEVSHLFSVVDELKARGVTILFVSHRIPEVFRLCDRMTVLRDGRFVGTFDRATTPPDAIVRAMVGREPPERPVRTPPKPGTAPALAVRGIARRPWVKDATFDVAAGEIVAIFGLVGSGRTELLETIFGVRRPQRGTISVAGRVISPKSPRDAARAGLALVPEERQRQGLFRNLSIRHNIVLPRAAKDRVRLIDHARERRWASEQIAALNIGAATIDRSPDTLSGGNQQKVVAAKWIATTPQVLLLDEPTKGVDVGAKFEIHQIIRREAARGMACLVVSSDLPEVLALADRIIVMREGRIRGEMEGRTATDEAVMRLATHEARP